jgi:putative glutamine amidotransferase
MRPLIAVTTWKRDLPTFWDPHSLLYTLSEHYVEALRAAGAVPLMLAHPDPEDAESIIAAVDGLLLTGGGDIDPASYGATNDGLSRDVVPNADRAELALISAASQRRLPTLGICRGMQILNVSAGGTMRQHVTTEGGPHGPEPKDFDLIKRHGHDVTLEPGSRLAQMYGTTRRFVNSYHHQGLDRVAEAFTVVARSDDGLPEAIEHQGAWVCMGVQWHPEKALDGTEDVLFAAFVEDVRQAAHASAA